MPAAGSSVSAPSTQPSAGTAGALVNAALQVLAAAGAAQPTVSDPPPMPARTAKELYTEEFTKALAVAPGEASSCLAWVVI